MLQIFAVGPERNLLEILGKIWEIIGDSEYIGKVKLGFEKLGKYQANQQPEILRRNQRYLQH